MTRWEKLRILRERQRSNIPQNINRFALVKNYLDSGGPERTAARQAEENKQRQMMSDYNSGKLDLMSEAQTRERRMAARSYDAYRDWQKYHSWRTTNFDNTPEIRPEAEQDRRLAARSASFASVPSVTRPTVEDYRVPSDPLPVSRRYVSMGDDELSAEIERLSSEYNAVLHSAEYHDHLNERLSAIPGASYTPNGQHGQRPSLETGYAVQSAVRDVENELSGGIKRMLDAAQAEQERRKQQLEREQNIAIAQSYIDEWLNFRQAVATRPDGSTAANNLKTAINSPLVQARAIELMHNTGSVDHMFDSEGQTLLYLLATGRDEDAKAYIKALDKGMLNPRQKASTDRAARAEAQRIANIDNGFVRGLASTWQAIQGGAEGAYNSFQNFGRMILGNDDVRTGVQELANSYNIERVSGESWVGGALLEALTATVQMAPAVAVGVLTGGAGTVAGMSVSSLASGSALFMQASGSSYAEAINNGHSVGEAALYGILNGALEVATEKFVGGVKGLASKSALGIKLGKAFATASERLIKNPTAQAIFNVLGSQLGPLISEGIEEAIQAVIEPFMKDAVLGEHNIRDNGLTASDVLESFLVGSLSALMLNGVSGSGIHAFKKIRAQQKTAAMDSAISDLQPMNNKPDFADTTVATAYTVDNPQIANVLNRLFQGQPISNSQAELLLSSPEAMSEIQNRTGVTVQENMTKSQQRSAVKQAMNGFYSRAQNGQTALISTLNQIAQETGAQVVDPGAKSVESLMNKVSRKAGTQADYNVFSAKDHARAALLVNDFNSVPQTIEALKKHFPNLSGEVFIDTPLNNSGYRGIHLSVAMDGGVNAEIQLSTPEAWAIKKQTDAIYDKWRNVDAETMTPEQEAAYNQDYAASAKLWEDYYAGLTPEVKRMASSSVIGLASNQTPNLPLNDAQVESTNSNNGNGFVAASNRPSSVNEYSTQTPPAESDSIIPQNAKNSNTGAAQDEHVGLFGGNTVGAAQAPVRKPHEELVNEYGALPRGEQLRDSQGNIITRDVEIAAQRYDNTRTSRWARTVAEAGGTPDEVVHSVQSMVERGELQYEATSNEKNIQKAKSEVDNALKERSLSAVEEQTLNNLYDESTSATSIAKGELLLKLAMERKDIDTILEFTAAIAAAGTRAGQTVQALSLLKRMGPGGALLAVQSQARKLNTRKQALKTKKSHQKAVERAQKAIDYIAETGEPSVEAVREGKRSARRQMKNIEDSLQKLEAAQKVLAIETGMTTEEAIAAASELKKKNKAYEAVERNAKLLEDFQRETGMTTEEAVSRLEELKEDVKNYKAIAKYQEKLRELQRDSQLSPEDAARERKAVMQEYDEAKQRLKEQKTWDGLVNRTIQHLQAQIARYSGDIVLPESILANIAAQTTQAGIDEALLTAYMFLADQLPSDWSLKLQNWRYLCMLANPKTHIRNFVGNATMIIPRIAARNFKWLFDTILPNTKRINYSGNKQAFYNLFSAKDRALRQYAMKDYNEAASRNAESNRYIMSQVISENQKIFRLNVLEKGSKWNFNLLEAEDRIFKQRIYAAEFVRQMKSRHLTLETITPAQLIEVQDASIANALKSTYQNVNKASKILSRATHINFGDSRGAKFGKTALSFIVPFAKTPINIANTAINYSPAGIVKSLVQFVRASKNTHDGSAALQTLSEGMTGTALTVMGWLLAELGYINGSGDDDDRANKYANDMGRQGYSLQIGDWSLTLDWLAPAAIPVFLGVELHNLFNDEQSGDFLADVVNSSLNLLSPMLEMSMLSSLDTVFDAVRFRDSNEALARAMIAIAGSGISQSIPTALSALGRTIDPTRRVTAADKTAGSPTLDGLWRQWAAKLPGLTYLLEPYVDVWGDTSKTGIGDVALNALENLISPGYFANGDWTPANEEIYSLYLRTGDSKVLPNGNPPSWWLKDNERIQLSAKEYTEFKQTRGQLSERLIEDITSSPTWNRLSDEKKIKAAQNAYETATEICKEIYYGEECHYSSEYARDAIYNAIISGAKGQKDIYGKTIPGTLKLAKAQALMEAGVSINDAYAWLNRKNKD